MSGNDSATPPRAEQTRSLPSGSGNCQTRNSPASLKVMQFSISAIAAYRDHRAIRPSGIGLRVFVIGSRSSDISTRSKPSFWNISNPLAETTPVLPTNKGRTVSDGPMNRWSEDPISQSLNVAPVQSVGPPASGRPPVARRHEKTRRPQRRHPPTGARPAHGGFRAAGLADAPRILRHLRP